MRTVPGILLGVTLLAACPASPPPSPTPPPATITVPVAESPDAACSQDAWAAEIASLGARAARGESVVAREGCALFDGELMARNLPKDDVAARSGLSLDAQCRATLRFGGTTYSFTREQGKLMVARARNVADESLAKEAESAAAAMGAAILGAARCPGAGMRLKDGKDAQVALAYALAADALRSSLAALDGKTKGPQPATMEALEKVCAKVRMPDFKASKPATAAIAKTLTDPGALEPFAAMALILAGSFTVFGEAAGKAKVMDKGLQVVAPAAAAVLASPPSNNLEAACAVYGMARHVASHGKARRK